MNGIEAPAWIRDAACGGMDVNEFFPDGGAPSTRAVRVCNACPVRFECLGWALDNREEFGLWGGLTPSQRQRLTVHQRQQLTHP